MFTITLTKAELEMVISWGETIESDQSEGWGDDDESAMKKLEEAFPASGTASVAGGTAEDLNQREFDFGDEEEE